MTIANPCLMVNQVLLLCLKAILGDQYFFFSSPPLLLLLHIIIMEKVEAQMNL